jgi:hypothetical protein
VTKRTSDHVEEERAGFRSPPSSDSNPGPADRDWGDDWVHELIEMTRPGIEINRPARGLQERAIPFEFDDFD